MDVLLDSGSGISWVVSSLCNRPICKSRKRLELPFKKSFPRVKVNYNKGHLVGKPIRVDIGVGDTIFRKVRMLAMVEPSWSLLNQVFSNLK